MVRWVADRSALNEILAALRECHRIPLDTEFERIRSYWPRLALIQAALPAATVLIDPLAFDDLGDLGQALVGSEQTWLMHSPSEDLIALAPLLPRPPVNLFDTQVAAALAGLGIGHGYQRLVSLLLGIDLEKSETRSDWMRRPLSERQIVYARDDVVHLAALADALNERLDALGRRDWVEQEGRRMIALAFAEVPPANLHHEYRNAWKLDPNAQRRLDALLRWREQLARDIDRPRSWVLDHTVVIDLAVSPPAQISELRRRLQAQRAVPHAKFGELFDLLHDPPNFPDFLLAPRPLDRDQEVLLTRLRTAIESEAAALAIEPSLLASRKALETRIRSGQWPADLPEWRRQRLDPIAKQVLGA